jgi:DNA-directed RNA polymerase specialized sigma subunit, sigma24 homolog
MRDDPSVITLVTRAAEGDQQAWDELIERYAPLVWAICTRYRLSNHDIEDVGQSVWLLLVEQLGKLREPAALPGWLATTTKRECLRVVTATRKSQQLGSTVDDARSRTSGRSTSRSSLPSGTRRCGRASPSFHRTPSSCWPCSSVTRRARIQRSARRWGSRSGASARSAPVA